MHSLVDRVEALVRSLPNIDHDYYLHNLSSLRTALGNVNLDQAAADLVRVIESGILRDIGFWAQQIEQLELPRRLEPDELREILAQLDQLFHDVRASGIDAELKEVVLDALEGVRRAIVPHTRYGRCLVHIQREILSRLLFHGSRPFLSFVVFQLQTYRKGRAFNMR